MWTDNWQLWDYDSCADMRAHAVLNYFLYLLILDFDVKKYATVAFNPARTCVHTDWVQNKFYYGNLSFYFYLEPSKTRTVGLTSDFFFDNHKKLKVILLKSLKSYFMKICYCKFYLEPSKPQTVEPSDWCMISFAPLFLIENY